MLYYDLGPHINPQTLSATRKDPYERPLFSALTVSADRAPKENYELGPRRGAAATAHLKP